MTKLIMDMEDALDDAANQRLTSGLCCIDIPEVATTIDAAPSVTPPLADPFRLISTDEKAAIQIQM